MFLNNSMFILLSSSVVSSFICFLLFTFSAIGSSNSGAYSGSYSGFALDGKSIGLTFLSSNNLMTLFLPSYSLIAFNKISFCSFIMPSFKFFWKESFYTF